MMLQTAEKDLQFDVLLQENAMARHIRRPRIEILKAQTEDFPSTQIWFWHAWFFVTMAERFGVVPVEPNKEANPRAIIMIRIREMTHENKF